MVAVFRPRVRNSPTGRCSDMLTAISDQSQLQIPTGNVCATSASSPEQLAKHYDQHATWLVTLLLGRPGCSWLLGLEQNGARVRSLGPDTIGNS